MKRRVGQCRGCKKEREIYALKMCGQCYQTDYQRRQVEKAKKNPKPRVPLNKVSLKGKVTAANDKTIYKVLWGSRLHRCEECGVHLGENPHNHYFSHILSKGAYPTLRHDLRNFNILCLEHHNQWEFGDKESMRIWEKNKDLIETLKREANER